MKDTLAVLLTCHNRKAKTLTCLQNLFEASLPESIKKADIYLVDDGSTDGTSKAVLKEHPNVNVIQGNGNLFWNQGMRLAWSKAAKAGKYDFYLWLNDDVILDKLALIELFDCYKETLSSFNQMSIITGAFKNSKFGNEFSYGGRTESENIIPNGNLQKCKYINGNTVLVSKQIYNELGNLSSDYTHAMGDFDYGLRSLKAGFNNYTTKTYIGVCPINEQPKWSNPNIALKTRLKLFKSPTGLNYKEYIFFRKKFWGVKWIIFAVKAYIKVLFPSFYKKLRV